MRIAAGILMIVFGMTMMGMTVDMLIKYGIHACDHAFNLFTIIAAVFFITGGVFCLKRKYWKLCFASSLCLLLFIILVFLLPALFLLTLVFIPVGILTIIFVCLRKSEWQEISA
jgi:hypothetical protein